jgi:predicted enzyme related to lactoylglutathione lyase
MTRVALDAAIRNTRSAAGTGMIALSIRGSSVMILGLRTVIYPTSDLQRAKAWYARWLGRQPYFDAPYYVGFTVGGFELGLLPDGTPGAGGAQALWGVADAQAAYDRLLELGAAPLEPLKDVGEGIRVAAVLDPFGNRLGLIENPNFDRALVR